jgi:phytoene synthase
MNESLSKTTSFYYPMLLLPAPRRRALQWLYRFCREADDIADDPGPSASKRKALGRLRRELSRGWKKGSQDPLVGPLLETGRPLGLTLGPLETILEGVKQDIRGARMRSFSELAAYSVKVAGGPGLASMEIFGFPDGPHREYAVHLGVFLQLVNVVRDVVEDFGMDRRYLPGNEWRKFGLSDKKLPDPGPAWDAFARFQLDRAWATWRKACACLDRHERGRLATAEAIAAVYARLHRKLYADPSHILQGRVGLSKPEKVWAALWTGLRCLAWKGLLNP